MRCASTMSCVESSFHMGLFDGTHRIVAACPQNFIPLQSGRTSGDIRVRLKYPIPSSASATSQTRKCAYRLLRSLRSARTAEGAAEAVSDISPLPRGSKGVNCGRGPGRTHLWSSAELWTIVYNRRSGVRKGLCQGIVGLDRVTVRPSLPAPAEVS